LKVNLKHEKESATLFFTQKQKVFSPFERKHLEDKGKYF